MNNITKPLLTESGKEKISLLFDDFDFDSIIEEISSGKFSPKADSLINKIISLFLGEIRQCFLLMGTLIALIIVCALLNNLEQSFGKKNVTAVSQFACLSYMAVIVAASFEKATLYVTETLRDITVLIHSIIPTMTVLAASGGGIGSAATMNPVIYFICSVFGSLIRNVVTPIVILRGVTALLCGLNNNEGMNEFSEIFSKLHKTLLALSMTLFAGILGITRFASTSFDNLAARGVKFAITATVPVVGGSIAEAMNSVAGSALLLKNAVGVAGVIMIFSMFVVPLIKLGALSLVFRLTGALAAPVSQKMIIDTIKKTGECIDMLFASVACMGIIMIISVAALV